jgi:ATP-binding cassette subfamily B protein IrtA
MSAVLGTLIAPVRGRVTVACIFSGIGAALSVGPAVAVAEIARILIDTPEDRGHVWTWVGVCIVTLVVSTAATMAASQISHHADAEFRVRTRRSVVSHLRRIPLGWFVSRGSGEVKKAVGDDVRDIHTLVAHTYSDAVGAAVVPLVACGYLFRENWLLAVILLGYIAVCLAVTAPRMNRGYRENMEAWEASQQRFQSGAVEVIDGIEVVKAYGAASGVFARFTRSTEDLSAVTARWMRGIDGPNVLLTSLFSAAGLSMWIVASGIGLMALDQAGAATVIAFLAVGTTLPTGLMHIIQLGYATREAQAAASHLATVLDTQPLSESDVPADPVDGSVEFERTSFAYEDGTVALDNVSLRCKPGTVTAVVGSSGSGKSTLARLIPRFWDATTGRVLLGGVDVRDIPDASLLGRVGLVFQDSVILRDTVAANLRLGKPGATERELEGAARAACIHDRITALPEGYGTILGETGAGLSGGELQRLAIARVLLQDAPTIVLDEATAHADPESEAEVQEAVSRLASGRTVIVIAHRLHTIIGADNIVVLDGGRVIEQGTHEELVTAAGAYAGLWQLQNPDEENS